MHLKTSDFVLTMMNFAVPVLGMTLMHAYGPLMGNTTIHIKGSYLPATDLLAVQFGMAGGPSTNVRVDAVCFVYTCRRLIDLSLSPIAGTGVAFCGRSACDPSHQPEHCRPPRRCRLSWPGNYLYNNKQRKGTPTTTLD